MKKVLFASFTIAATVWLYTFAILSSSLLASCKHDRIDPAPAPATGWNNTEYEAPVNDGDATLPLSLCDKKPRNLSIDVYEFDAGTDPAAAVNAIFTEPDPDDENAPDQPLPTETVMINLREDMADGPISNFKADGTTELKISTGKLTVLVADDDNKKRTVLPILPMTTSAVCLEMNLSAGRRNVAHSE